MAASSSVFPFERIVLTAAITAGIALVVLGALRARFKTLALVDCLLVALVVGGSVLVWRSVGNTGALNDDPIPGVSPNDVLCPLVTYLFLGWKEGEFLLEADWEERELGLIRRPSDAMRFEQARVVLALVCFVVNVVTS